MTLQVPQESQASQPTAQTDSAATAIPPEVFKLPPQVQQQVISIIQAQHWSGPIPSPDALEKYEKVIPGSANRLLQLAEKEQAHRHSMDRESLSTKARDVRRGQYLGAGIGVLAVGGAIGIASVAPVVAVALVGVPVASIINAIINARSSAKKQPSPPVVPPA